MRLLAKSLFVETSELVDLGVSYNTIHCGVILYRAGKSHAWANLKDPDNKRRLLILYSSIPKRTRRNLPSEADMLARHAKEAAAAKELAVLLPKKGR